jgi:hypothetical protein
VKNPLSDGKSLSIYLDSRATMKEKDCCWEGIIDFKVSASIMSKAGSTILSLKTINLPANFSSFQYYIVIIFIILE